ncbi:unnamed protein product [Mytilus coruscus]|uniref:Uncharacterized protein n=1 Tax=Mytilus coruscus TaxID=42192 RepID=A0A6J8AMV7_MYTCO|nr:unnamed protein product [Mytilus coruscus]
MPTEADNNKHGRKIPNDNRLIEPEIKKKFVIELRNRFRVLADLDQTKDSSTEKKWENIKEKDKEVKKKARKDKKNHLEERAEQAEKAAARGNISTVYKITKELCLQSKPPPVKDKTGNIITTKTEQAAHWIEHFMTVLNRPELINEFQGTPQLRYYQ